jgi:hypothetical protein
MYVHGITFEYIFSWSQISILTYENLQNRYGGKKLGKFIYELNFGRYR